MLKEYLAKLLVVPLLLMVLLLHIARGICRITYGLLL